MTKHLLLVALLLLSCGAADAAPLTYKCGSKTYSVSTPLRPMCSNTITFIGVCDGQDQVTTWSQVISTAFNGPLPEPKWQVKPWTDTPITIVGLDLLQTMGGPSLYWIVGNAHTMDVMMTMGAGETRSAAISAIAGGGWVFPSKYDATTSPAYLDLHGACTGGGMVQMVLTVYYLPEVAAEPPLPPGFGTVFQATLDSDSSDFGGYTAVQRFEPSALEAPTGTPSEIRVHWQGAGSGLSISSAYVCEAASSGDPYDCASAPVPMTISSNLGTATFAWGKTTPLLVRWYMSDANADRFKFKWSSPNVQSYNKAANDGAAADLSGYATGSSLAGISKVEMNGF